MSNPENSRESMEVDILIVGGGVAGLSTAIQLKKNADAAGQDISIIVLEKAAELGAHILSGAVIDPIGLNALIPEWQQKGAPLSTAVTSDSFSVLTEKGGFSIPSFLLPPTFSNHGNYIASLGNVTKWMGEQAENMGIDIFPGFAATKLIKDDAGSVLGAATGDIGVGKDGQPKSGFADGMDLLAKYTVIAEGARGSLAKQVISDFDLEADCDPQHYGLGVKEVWEIDPANHELGKVEHTLGWPLDSHTSGGGFIYHAQDNKLFLGFITHLNYENPHRSPFDEMQKYKTHPKIKALLDGGRRISYGARAMTSGGWQSIPKLSFPGGVLVGCSAGFMNFPRIKGSHTAILSGIKMANLLSEALAAGRANDTIENARERVTDGEIEKDLYIARNAKPFQAKFGMLVATFLTGFDLWMQTLFKFSLFGTLRGTKPDHDYLKPANECEKINYPKPDGVLTFDRQSSLFLSNIGHEEDQPTHLQLMDANIPISQNLPTYGEPAQLYCPAGVYEVIEQNGKPAFRINAANCVHCKTCDIKDPAQNITWVPPEGGSGPNYEGM